MSGRVDWEEEERNGLILQIMDRREHIFKKWWHRSEVIINERRALGKVDPT
jgi:hypothetical protein